MTGGEDLDGLLGEGLGLGQSLLQRLELLTGPGSPGDLTPPVEALATAFAQWAVLVERSAPGLTPGQHRRLRRQLARLRAGLGGASALLDEGIHIRLGLLRLLAGAPTNASDHPSGQPRPVAVASWH